MKQIKLFFALAIAASFLFQSCTKEGPAGPAGATGAPGATGATGATGQPGPSAKVFDFNLTFNAGDEFKAYPSITGFDANDVLLFYVNYETLSGVLYWAPLPLTQDGVSYIPEFSNTTGQGFINTIYSDGTPGSPWAASITLGFRIVLIKATAKNPNVNYNDYNAVKAYYGLKD